MTVKYKTVITKAGAEKLAAATVPNGAKVNFTAMAIGDGGGTLPTPDASQTKLVNEVWRYALNKISQDNKNKNYVVAELLIPPERGGFWMREMGLYDDTGTLIAVGNMAESYKPELAEGSGRAQTVRMVIMVSDIESVELTIDTTLVMATQDYVDDKLAEHEKSRRHPDATLTEKGFTQLSSATDSTSESVAATPKAVKAAYDLADGKYTAQDATTARKGITQLSSSTASTSETLAATPKAVKTVMDATKLKAPLESPALTGTPTAPTAPQSSNDTQLATTEFVIRALNDLGLGVSSNVLTALDWQTFDFVPGALYMVSSGNMTNVPAGMDVPGATYSTLIRVNGPEGTTRHVDVCYSTTTSANYRYYQVRVAGAAGSRTLTVRKIFNSTDVIPVANGGTGATTAPAARTNLGFDAMGIGVPVPMVSALDWQTFDFIPGAQHVCLPSNQKNIPAGLTYVSTTAPTNINVLGGRGNTTALILLVTQFTTAATAKSYFIVVSGSPPARTFTIYENFTSASIVPLANGGTGGKTVDEARGNLGVNRLVQGEVDTYITSQSDNYRLFVNDQGGWGVLNNIGTPQPLALDKGGTGATDAAKARVNLELGNSATRNVGSVANTVAAGNDSRIVNAVQKAEFTSGPGWVKFPDGTIIQTGVAQAGYLGFPSDITYPIPFTVGGPTIVANFDSAVASANDCPAFATTPLTNASFRLMSSRVNTGSTPYARWIAIGK